ncbi:MAG: segregation and condensation protein A [Eubacteriales bacterium]
MEELNYKLEVFEGPLDLLLRLIIKNKVNIYDIPIVLIFEQYMQYIDKMQAVDMEVTGEFISMAAELMLIKSKMLLPKIAEATEEDPRARLAAALEEYKRMKESAISLSEHYAMYGGRIVKEPEVIDEEFILNTHDIKLLQNAFRIIMRRNTENNETFMKPEKTIGNLLSYRTVSVTGRIYSIMRHLYKNGDTSFKYIILTSVTRSEIIATFMALLELLGSQRIIISDESDEVDKDYILHLNKEHNSK